MGIQEYFDAVFIAFPYYLSDGLDVCVVVLMRLRLHAFPSTM